MRPRGVAGIGLVPKSALWLFPSAAAQQAATLDARRRKWKFLYWRGALTSKYPVPSGPRVTKALTFRQYLFNRFFFYLFPSKYKSFCPSAEIRKKRAYSAVAH